MGDQQFPVFIVTVIWIVESDLARIVKTTSGFLKGNTMLLHIGSAFSESHSNAINMTPPLHFQL